MILSLLYSIFFISSIFWFLEMVLSSLIFIHLLLITSTLLVNNDWFTSHKFLYMVLLLFIFNISYFPWLFLLLTMSYLVTVLPNVQIHDIYGYLFAIDFLNIRLKQCDLNVSPSTTYWPTRKITMYVLNKNVFP